MGAAREHWPQVVASGDNRSPVDKEPATLPWWLLAGVFFVVVVVYGVSPVVTNGDSYLVAPTSASIANDLDLDISEYLGPGTAGGVAWVGNGDTGGQQPGVRLSENPPYNEPVYDFFPWTTSVFGVLLYIVLLIPGALLGIGFFDPRRMLIEGDAGLFNLIGGSVLTALTVAVVAATVHEALVDRRTDERSRRRVVIATAAVVAFGTSAWSVLSRAMWSQSTSTLLVALALYEAVRFERADARGRHRWAIALGVTLAVAYTARPTNAVAVVVFGIWLFVCHRRHLMSYMTAGAAVAIVWVTVNLATWGTLQPPYFSADRAVVKGYVFEALAANLLSPNRGLLVFTPVAVLSAVGAWSARQRKRRTELVAVGVGIVVAHWLLVSASGENWWAGSAYGPRFMADVIPVMAFLAVPIVVDLTTHRRPLLQRGAIVLAAISILMHLPGGWSKPAHCWSLGPPRIDDDPSRVWDWGNMQALEPVRVLLDGGSPREAVLRNCDPLLDEGVGRVAAASPIPFSSRSAVKTGIR